MTRRPVVAASLVALVLIAVSIALARSSGSAKSPTSTTRPTQTPAQAVPAPAQTPRDVVLDAEQADILKRTVHLASATMELQKAMTSKFGADAARVAQGMGTGVSEADVTAATQTTTGNAAVDLGRAGPGQIPLIKRGQTWKISSEVLRKLNRQSVIALKQKTPAIRQLAADITAGKYKTPARRLQPPA